MTAIDTVSHADVPASLRGTSLALVCCFAAPLLVRPSTGVSGAWQRPAIGACLLTVALVGAHHGGSQTRAFDALYTTIVGVIVIWLFSAGGVDEAAKAAKSGALERAVSTSASMLSSALLLYGSTRMLRAGLWSPSDVRQFEAAGANVSSGSTLGYAYSSELATASVCFGAAAGVGAAITVAVHALELAEGTGTVALQLGVAAGCQLVAALAAALTYGDAMEWLPAVFGSFACRSASDTCAAAAASRRFAMVNTQVVGTWLSALGTFALAYPPSCRLYSHDEVAQWGRTGALFGLAATSASLLLLYSYSTFSGVGSHTDYVALVAVLAISWSAFADTFFGTVLFTIAVAAEEVVYVNEHGVRATFQHLTHVTFVACLLLLALHTAVQVWTLAISRNRTTDVALGVITVAGTSLSVALYCASACLILANNGSMGSLHGAEPSRFAISFILQHFTPVLAWAPLYTCRCEVQLLSRLQKLGAWAGAVPAVTVAYCAVLTVLDLAPSAAALVDTTALLGCTLGVGVAPWLAASSV